jgi:hypothetical protein
MRPEVQLPPPSSAVMSRLPLPSRWTFEVELVIVSISPVPKVEPAPVSYIHCPSAPLPAEPVKSSLKTVLQPEGAPGAAAEAVVANVIPDSSAQIAVSAVSRIRRPSRGAEPRRRTWVPDMSGGCGPFIV